MSTIAKLLEAPDTAKNARRRRSSIGGTNRARSARDGSDATPSAIKFVAALPKTRSGKIMRRLLKAQETGAEIGDLSTLEQ
jgi:acyl-CoA synthetase (AMP-forming)/AMP-acid ligase II